MEMEYHNQVNGINRFCITLSVNYYMIQQQNLNELIDTYIAIFDKLTNVARADEREEYNMIMDLKKNLESIIKLNEQKQMIFLIMMIFILMCFYER